jgi:hypothetical protein
MVDADLENSRVHTLIAEGALGQDASHALKIRRGEFDLLTIEVVHTQGE